MKRKKVLLHVLVVICIAGAVLLCYGHTLDVPFVFDDRTAIVENQKIRDVDRFLHLKALTAQRPLADLTFAVNYTRGELDVFGYHVVNIAIHIISACLVYALAMLVFRRVNPGSDSRNTDSKKFILPAVFTALVFALHPVQTQAVTYIVQRYTSMAALFYLGAVVCYVLGRQSMQFNPKSAPPSSAMTKGGISLKSIGLFTLSFACGLAAFLSKQTALSLPLAILLMEYLLFDRTWAGWKKKLVYLLPLCAAFIVFVLYSAGVLQGDISLGRLLEETDQRTRETMEVSRLQYLMTQFQVITIYLGQLIWPANLSLDFMYPFVDSLFQNWTFWGLLLLLTLVAAGFWLRRKQPFISMGIFWFFIALSVESSLIPISDALFIHRLYLPMFGFALVLGIALHQAVLRWKYPALLAAVLLVCVLSVVTFQRNQVWQDRITLWSDTVSKRPENPRAHNNLGQALEDEGHIQDAAKHYRKALALQPGYADAHLNLGLVLAKSGRLDQAGRHFVRAAERRPGLAKAHYNLGLVRQSQKELKEAGKHYQRALKADPGMQQARLNLAGVLAETNRPQKAIEQLDIILSKDPRHFDALMNKASLLYMTGRSSQALEVVDQALEIRPESVQAGMNKGIMLIQSGQPNEAVQTLSRVLKEEPKNQQARQLLFQAMQSLKSQ